MRTINIIIKDPILMIKKILGVQVEYNTKASCGELPYS